MEFMNDYLVLVVLGICLCIGYIIKYVVPNKKVNQYIPMIVGVLGVVLNVWVNGFAISPEILLGGLISGLASTGMYEALRNFIEKFKDDREE